MSHAPFPSRRTEDLRRGRVSLAGAEYFVTWCTEGRERVFADERAMEKGHQAFTRVAADGDIRLTAATLMPDHVHMLFHLGGRLPLERVIAKVKAEITRTHDRVRWQRGFFEHQVRSHEERESYAWYIFMNPYVANLVNTDSAWWGWWKESKESWSFLELARPGPCPQPEWLELNEVKRRSSSLVTGE